MKRDEKISVISFDIGIPSRAATILNQKKKNLALDLSKKKSKTSKNKNSQNKVLKNSKRRNSLRNSSRSKSSSNRLKIKQKKSNQKEDKNLNLSYLKAKRKRILDNSSSLINNSGYYLKPLMSDRVISNSINSSRSVRRSIRKEIPDMRKRKNASKVMIRKSLHLYPGRMKSRDSSRDTLVIKKNLNNEIELKKLRKENSSLKSEISDLKSELKQVRKHLSNFLTQKNQEVGEMNKKLEEAIQDNTLMANQQSNLLNKYLETEEELRKMKKLMLHYPSQKSIIQQSSRESSVVAMSNFLIEEIKKGDFENEKLDFTKEKNEDFKKFKSFDENEIVQKLNEEKIEYSSFIVEKDEEVSEEFKGKDNTS